MPAKAKNWNQPKTLTEDQVKAKCRAASRNSPWRNFAVSARERKEAMEAAKK